MKNRINHTVFTDEEHELTHASAALGEHLLENGRSLDFTLRLSSVAARVLAHDAMIREQRHNHYVQGRIFKAPGEVVQVGLKKLLDNEIEEPFGLELGHIVNLGIEGGVPSRKAESRLTKRLKATLKSYHKEVTIDEPLNPSQTFRTIRYADDNDGLVVGAIRTPIVDIHSDITRVEVHARSSFGLYAEDRSLELEDARSVLEKYEENKLLDGMFSEIPRKKGSVYVFPATTTLVGLRRSRRLDS